MIEPLSEVQTRTLINAYQQRHAGGTTANGSVAGALERRGLLTPAEDQGTEGPTYWHITRDGETALALNGVFLVWGAIRKVHQVGPYAIVESDRNRPVNVPEKEWGYGRVSFHPYLYGPDGWYNTGHSYGSLDAALISVIAWRHIEREHGRNAAANSRATQYIMRMIGADHADED